MRAGLANAFSTRCLIFDKIPPDVGIITISTVFTKYKKKRHTIVKNKETTAISVKQFLNIKQLILFIAGLKL